MPLPRDPLFRLLAINVTIGASVAVLMLGGLLLLNPHGLRDLIFADRSGVTAAVLLLFGFVITFGSTAMGSAIMMLGRSERPSGGKGARAVDPVAALAEWQSAAGEKAYAAPGRRGSRARNGG